MLFCSDAIVAAEDAVRGACVVVQGAPGENQYGTMFTQWSQRWLEYAQRADLACTWIGNETTAGADETDRSRLLATLASLDSQGSEPVWLIFNGHGTYAAHEKGKGVANFNLRGPDISATDLADALKRFDRPLIIVQCASSSGPFLAELSAVNRVVVAATRGGEESNFARFGEFLSIAIGDPSADLDHDEQVSVLEAFLKASADTKQFYQQSGRLQTEHSLIDDNGDLLGTSADFFRGVRPIAKAKDDQALDGLLAARFVLLSAAVTPDHPVDAARVREILAELETMRQNKENIAVDEYYVQIERLIMELIKLEQPPVSAVVSP
jgi:chorismate mutase